MLEGNSLRYNKELLLLRISQIKSVKKNRFSIKHNNSCFILVIHHAISRIKHPGVSYIGRPRHALSLVCRGQLVSALMGFNVATGAHFAAFSYFWPIICSGAWSLYISNTLKVLVWPHRPPQADFLTPYIGVSWKLAASVSDALIGCEMG